MRKFVSLLAGLGLAAFLLQPASAGTPSGSSSQPYGVSQGARNSQTPELPHCDRPIGTVAVHEPVRQWWRDYNLGSSEVLIKLFAQRSNCLRVLDRNAGLAMREQERDLAASGELQRGSNIGGGQVRAADFFLIPDIANSDNNSGGNNVAAGLGGIIGGRLGGVIGSVQTQRQTAQVLITLVDARTTEQLYIAEGTSQHTNVSIGAGGGLLGGSAAAFLAGSGYSDTDIGRVISAAYFNAFVDLVHYMQNQNPGEAQAAAPIAAQRVIPARLTAFVTPSSRARVAFTLSQGQQVFPTGGRSGVWMEIDDENGNRGWVNSTQVSAR